MAGQRVKESRMIPVFISPDERLVTVFGGGVVALRKCLHFKGFRIKVVSESFLPQLRDMADECIEIILNEENCGGYMDGAFLIIAATGSKKLNRKILEKARDRGILTNSSHGGGDLLIPSVLRREGFAVAVSSEGRVPVFSPYVISKINQALDPAYDGMLRLLSRVRPKIMDGIGSQAERAEILSNIINNEEIWNLLRSGNEGGAYEIVCRAVKL